MVVNTKLYSFLFHSMTVNTKCDSYQEFIIWLIVIIIWSRQDWISFWLYYWIYISIVVTHLNTLSHFFRYHYLSSFPYLSFLYFIIILIFVFPFEFSHLRLNIACRALVQNVFNLLFSRPRLSNSNFFDCFWTLSSHFSRSRVAYYISNSYSHFGDIPIVFHVILFQLRIQLSIFLSLSWFL